jgi:hypothetical protein
MPVRVKKIRKNKTLELFHVSMKREKALAPDQIGDPPNIDTKAPVRVRCALPRPTALSSVSPSPAMTSPNWRDMRRAAFMQRENLNPSAKGQGVAPHFGCGCGPAMAQRDPSSLASLSWR